MSRDIELDDMVTEWLNAKADLDKIKTHLDELADEIVHRLGVGGSHEIMEGVGVRVQAPARRWHTPTATQLLTQEQLDAISIRVPSQYLAKEFLPGALVDQCRRADGKPSVREL